MLKRKITFQHAFLDICYELMQIGVFCNFISVKRHDIHIKPESYKLELLGELVV